MNSFATRKWTDSRTSTEYVVLEDERTIDGRGQLPTVFVPTDAAPYCEIGDVAVTRDELRAYATAILRVLDGDAGR